MSSRDKKSERRSSDVTMDKLEYQAKVMLGKAEERRTPPEIYNSKNPVGKKSEEKNSMSAGKKKTVSTKLRWSQASSLQLARAIIVHKDDYNAFISETVGKLKSEAGETASTIYEAKPFEEKHIVSKARAIIKQMNKDGHKVKMPAANKKSGLDYNKLYADLGDLLPAKGRARKKR